MLLELEALSALRVPVIMINGFVLILVSLVLYIHDLGLENHYSLLVSFVSLSSIISLLSSSSTLLGIVVMIHDMAESHDLA